MAYIADYGAYTYGVRSNIDFRGHGWDTSVLVDGDTGQLRSVDLARGQHLGNSIFNLLWGIHFADLRDWLPYRILCLSLRPLPGHDLVHRRLHLVEKTKGSQNGHRISIHYKEVVLGRTSLEREIR